MATSIADLFLRISAKNETGNVFGQIANQIDGKMVGSITRGVLQANLLTAGFSAIVSKAQEAAQSMTGALNQAKQLQLEQINAATTFASLTGKSYEEAVTVIESLNNRLAKSAATLPGATQEYKNLATTIQDNVLEAFKAANGEVDLKGFEDTVTSISESFGALTAASTKQVGNTAMGLTYALGGSSVASLRTNMFFEQNPVILNEIEKRLQQLGAKSLRDLDIKTRVKLIEEVGKKFITEDFKKQASKSVDGLIQNFKSVLFDPSGGVFGVMRDLDKQMNGTQSAFSAYNEALDSLIGEDGLFGTKGPIVALGTALGLNKVDPMKILQGAFNDINTGIKAVSAFVLDFAMLVRSGINLRDVVLGNLGSIRGKIAEFFSNLLTSAADGLNKVLGGAATFLEQAPIGELLASVFNGVTTALAGLNMTGLGSQIGRILAALVNQIGKLLEKIDIGTLLVAVGRLAMAAIIGIAMALSKLDWQSVLLIGLTIFTAWASTVLVGALIGALTSAFAGLISAILAVTVGWPLLIAAGVAALVFLIAQNWDAISAYLGKFLDTAKQFITTSIPIALITMLAGVVGFFVWMGKAIATKFDETIRWIGDKINEAGNAISGLFQMIVNKVKSLVPGSQQKAEEAKSTIGSSLSNLPDAGAFANVRYGGQIPSAFGGLLGAISQEMAAAPSGAKPVIANSSEFILRPSQAQAFAAGAAMGGGGKSYTFSPTINLAAGTPESHAQEILRYFEIWLSEHQQASLA